MKPGFFGRTVFHSPVYPSCLATILAFLRFSLCLFHYQSTHPRSALILKRMVSACLSVSADYFNIFISVAPHCGKAVNFSIWREMLCALLNFLVRSCKMLKATGYATLLINIFSMPKSDNINDKFLVKNIVNNTVVANSNSVTVSTF